MSAIRHIKATASLYADMSRVHVSDIQVSHFGGGFSIVPGYIGGHGFIFRATNRVQLQVPLGYPEECTDRVRAAFNNPDSVQMVWLPNFNYSKHFSFTCTLGQWKLIKEAIEEYNSVHLEYHLHGRDKA